MREIMRIVEGGTLLHERTYEVQPYANPSVRVLENPSWAAVKRIADRAEFNSVKGFLADTNDGRQIVFAWNADDLIHPQVQQELASDHGFKFRIVADLSYERDLAERLADFPEVFENYPDWQYLLTTTAPIVFFRHHLGPHRYMDNPVIRSWPVQKVDWNTIPDDEVPDWHVSLQKYIWN